MTASRATSNLAHQLHQTLRALHSPTKLAASPLLQSPILVQQQKLHPTATPVQLLSDLLLQLHDELHQRRPQSADLLHGRFWEGVTAERMVQLDRPEPQSISRFYQQQEQAIQWLVQLWEEAERVAAHAERATQLVRRLPSATYTHFFGVDSVRTQIVPQLADPAGPAIITIKGIGGIGKTAAADYAVRTLLQQAHPFDEVVWISAKQEFLTPSGITSLHRGRGTQLRLEQIFDEIGEKLALPDVKQLPLARKVDLLAEPLRDRPHLIVIDNLETVEEFQALVPWLSHLSEPTKFLLTSRETIPALGRVVTVDLDELDREAAIALAHHTAAQKQITDCDGDAVYTLVGGNPLAIILVVSLMYRLPPAQVFAAIRSGATEDLYTYIYYQSWSLISRPAKEFLFTLQRAGDSAEWRWLEMVYTERANTLHETIAELLAFSLLYCQPGLSGERRYTIHRLTSTFLRTEILGWK